MPGFLGVLLGSLGGLLGGSGVLVPLESPPRTPQEPQDTENLPIIDKTIVPESFRSGQAAAHFSRENTKIWTSLNAICAKKHAVLHKPERNLNEKHAVLHKLFEANGLIAANSWSNRPQELDFQHSGALGRIMPKTDPRRSILRILAPWAELWPKPTPGGRF